MSTIRAFRAIRPVKELVKYVASPPYDVMNRHEAKAMAEGNPYSFIHVTRAEIDLPNDTDIYSPVVYEKAKQNFNKLLEDKVLFQDKSEHLYLYGQQIGAWSQCGLVACSSNTDYFNNIIKKHEFTRPQKERDRINHIKTTGIQSGPVFLTYPPLKEIDTIISEWKNQHEAEYDFKSEDGVQHTFWVIDNSQTVNHLIELFKHKVPYTYIADGHHRAASSAKVGRELAAQNPNHTGEEEYNFFLSVLFPTNQINIIDYNRVVKDLNGLDSNSFLAELSKDFDITEKGDQPFKPTFPHEIGMYLDKQWYCIHAKTGTYPENDPVEELDVSILQNNVLDKLLGIKDPRNDDRVDFVGGIRGLEALEKRVDTGEMKVAFSLYPVSIEQLMRIADTGNVMPPKSTWFEPKLRSGLVIHRINNDDR